MGNNFLVQNNFGASLGGPIWQEDILLCELRRLPARETEHGRHGADAEEVAGDFSQSGVEYTTQHQQSAQPAPGEHESEIPSLKSMACRRRRSSILTKHVPQPNNDGHGCGAP